MKITDPCRAGGMLGVKKPCAICEAAGIPVVLHWSRAGVSQAAWLHLAVSNRAFLWAQDILPPNVPCGPVEDIIAQPFAAVDGWLAVPEGPGLGVEVDPEKLEKHPVRRTAS